MHKDWNVSYTNVTSVDFYNEKHEDTGGMYTFKYIISWFFIVSITPQDPCSIWSYIPYASKFM